MSADPAAQDRGSRETPGLGPALRRAWVGYQRRLDTAMREAGFGERRFPDGRVLRLTRARPGSTIADIGRALGMSRQGANKIVAELRERGYVTVEPSTTSGREKAVTLTQSGSAYLDAQRDANLAIQRELDVAIGPDALVALHRLLDALGGSAELSLREYLESQRSFPRSR